MEDKLLTAAIGAGGAVIGVVVTVAGQIVRDWLQQLPANRLRKGRKRLLKRMLKDDRFPKHWRKLSILSHCVGADETITKDLLIELGARASEDGKPLWGLISLCPFPGSDDLETDDG